MSSATRIPPVVEFRLYVAGSAPNSRRALANLERFCVRHLPDRHRIDVVDISSDRQRALADRILMTPTLVLVSPPRPDRLVGDLGDIDKLREACGLSASNDLLEPEATSGDNPGGRSHER